MVTARSIREITLTETVAAKTLDAEREAQFKLSVRKEDIRNNPRGGTITAFKSRISDGFGESFGTTIRYDPSLSATNAGDFIV